MKKVDIYTDGSCEGNPGRGGWCAILIYKGAEKVLTGAEQSSTNNRMELTAIIKGLEALKEKCEVTVYSDSSYALNAFLEGWIYSWIAKGWTKKDGELKNVDLWKQLHAIVSKHKVTFIKVKGHSDNELNNRCDIEAKNAIKTLNQC
ncbi:MAG: ribonuclease HI [Firmicutes bacterium]|nr:ribonuclease HI [Bacillota bacterium]